MTEIIGITSSFFAVIALGAFTKYIGLFDEKSSQIFSNFAFYVALPPLIITSIMNNQVSGIINFDYIIRFEIATLIIFLFSYFFGPFQSSIVTCLLLAKVNLLSLTLSVIVDPEPIVEKGPIVIGATRLTLEPTYAPFPINVFLISKPL